MPAGSSSHRCPGWLRQAGEPATRCTRRVRSEYLACRLCWYHLPRNLRNQVTATWKGRDPQGHREAMVDATRWWRENPRTAEVPHRGRRS